MARRRPRTHAATALGLAFAKSFQTQSNVAADRYNTCGNFRQQLHESLGSDFRCGDCTQFRLFYTSTCHQSTKQVIPALLTCANNPPMLRPYLGPNSPVGVSGTFNKKSLLSVATQLMLSVFLFNQVPLDIFSATCTGADPCHACKNCKYCKHCGKDGGKCGVCK
jgi:hypothetical protein